MSSSPTKVEFGTTAESSQGRLAIAVVDQSPIATGVTAARLAGLRRWNLGLTVLHLAQAVLILFLANDFAIAVTSSFPEGPPGTPVPAPATLFEVSIGLAIAIFLGLAALDHVLTGTVGRGAYERDLRRGINRFRWVEYSFSATLMIILISFYSGITSINAVIAVAGANVGMILFGWLQERMNRGCPRSRRSLSGGPPVPSVAVGSVLGE